MNLSQAAALKQAIRDNLTKPSRRVLENPGGGIAVLRPGRGDCILSQLSLVEGVHFDLGYTSAREAGHRALAMAISKAVPLGARPRFASIGVGLRQEHGEIFVGELFSGATALARLLEIDLVAEHTFPSPSFLVLTITVVCEPLPKVKLLAQSKARKGDLLAVTGFPGASACGLTLLRRMGRGEADKYTEARDAHLRPLPRVAAAEWLARSGKVTSVVELRDGLARDLHRLAEACKVGALLDLGAIPVPGFVRQVASFLGSDFDAWTLYGGEDFELLFSAPAKAMEELRRVFFRKKMPLAVVGEIRPRPERVRLKNRGGDIVPLLPLLWSDYARRSRPS